MSMDERLKEYSDKFLGGRAAPADLAILLKSKWAAEDDEDAEDLPEAIGFTLIDDGVELAQLDFSYLTEKDLADPDIRANVAAMKDVFARIVFVGENVNGDAFGYWLDKDKDDAPLDQTPIVVCDSEGQFNLMPGRNLIEAILFDLAGDPSDFDEARDELNEMGFEISATSLKDLREPVCELAPAELHDQRYRAHGG